LSDLVFPAGRRFEAAEPVTRGENVIELVLPLVVRIERDSPPTRTDALEAAARAALLMLTSDRPEWRAAVDLWDGQRIRKVVRRARGAEWRRASSLDGLDVHSGSAEVRVYPPIPIDGWPPELSRLQVSGTELADPSRPADPAPGVPLILLTPYVEMTAGKAMAQAAHAAQLGWRASSVAQRAAWQADGFELAVRDATKREWAAALAARAPVVHDGGFTEVEPDTQTALAVLPWL
jgi:peptidyl-tRNA hydrolase